jgi:multiple sugar transport system substrate-binding protein
MKMKIVSDGKTLRTLRPIVAIGRSLFFIGLFSFGVAWPTSQSLAEDKVVELKFTLWGSPFEKQAIEKAVASFNASHPTIHVTAQHIPYEAYGEKISAMLATGEPPDVAYLDFAQAFPFADGGKILDLTSYFAKQPTDQGVLETSFYRFDHGKKLLGTGLATGVILLYYNKELFDAAKLPYPPATAQDAWTWDKFVDVAKKLTKDRHGNDATSPNFDPNNIVTYGLSLPQDWWSYLTFIDSNGGSFVNKEGTELLLNRPESVQVLQALQDAIYVDHITPRPTQNKALPSADIQMQTGKVAMTFNGMWKVVDFSFTFYLYISDPTKVDLFREGLWAPLEKRYFTDPEFTKQWLQGKPGVYPPEAQTVLVDYSLHHAGPPPPMYWLRNIDRIMNEAVIPAMDQLWSGKVKAQAAADQAVEKAKPLLQGTW